jgi:hypothetical protein
MGGIMFKKSLIPMVAAVILASISVTDVQAIPAFARKYKISCSTCHIAMPKLKAYGDEFAGNGFLLPDGEEPKRAYIDTGDDMLLLNSDFPIAVRLDAYAQVANRDNVNTDLGVPFGIKLMSGGPISKKVSYYFYFYLSEGGDVAGVEDAFLYFNDIGGIPFDLTVGQFQVSDPLYKRELRLTYEDYQIFRVTPGLSKANLTYDRGLVLDYGFDFGLGATAMLVNGNGIKPAEDDIFDSDNGKSYALRLTQEIGPVTIGGFAYSGQETLSDSADAKNNVLYLGPDINVATEHWELVLQYLHREDDNVYFHPAAPMKSKVDGGFAEFTLFPQGDQSLFIYTLLYNYIDSDISAYNYNTATVSVSHLAARNLRFMAEITYNIETEKPRFTVGAVAAF